MNNANSKRKARDISIFDFSSLYTNLQHQDIIKVLHKHVKFSFNGGYKDQNGCRKHLTVIGTEYIWIQKKRRFNRYTM